jgi:N-acyl homoserine lactone hydrolase
MSSSLQLHALHCGGERINMAVLDPFDPAPARRIEIPYFAYLIRHPKGDVLFDTGAHVDLATDPHKRLGEAADTWDVAMQPGDDIVSQLAKLSVKPGDIAHVCLSHLHLDHGGGIEFFPQATFYVQSQELPFAFWPAVYQRSSYCRQDFDHPVRWKELRGEYDLFGDGHVVLFPTPGHTPGHQSMFVQLKSSSMVLVGDAAYLPSKMEARLLPAAGLVWSSEAMVESWEKLEEWSRLHGAQLICNHDFDFEQKLKVSPSDWYE